MPDEEVDGVPEPYFAYWGKARPEAGEGALCHKLPFHALDVAACAQVLSEQSRFGMETLALSMGWQADKVRHLSVFFAALHDVGKFSNTFQALAPELAPAKTTAVRSLLAKPLRHDTMGWLLWQDSKRFTLLGRELDDDAAEIADVWMRVSTGHHGKPPREDFGAWTRPKAGTYFSSEDMVAAGAFVRDMAALLLPERLPDADERARSTLVRGSWLLAGLAVLADWLGSNAHFFPYRSEPLELRAYWETVALPRACNAVRAAGLETHETRSWSGAREFLEFAGLTPLQEYAATAKLGSGPQIFLLEDVTGAGKTEAALLLTHRMMAAGLAQGLYFALPTMATANQMYDRTACVYRKFYAEGEVPSLVLAHGARKMVDGFRNSVLAPCESPEERTARGELATGSAQLNAWLADSGKKALLADVGVGTIDQALLGVLPVRHQSLRLLGLAKKILIVDEVHAYDSYMTQLLENLVEAQAAQGGCVILLSATVPARLRRQLMSAFARGAGVEGVTVQHDDRYPLATHLVEGTIRTDACETRSELKRRVAVQPLHAEDAVVERMSRIAAEGRCACWIRNTVEDARRSYDCLRALVGAERVGLFHSRFAMADRMEIEGRVLRGFGKESGPGERRGRLLVATQVVEQSLDLDFDELFVDLAPMDLVIQRAGRLRRHTRTAEGKRTSGVMDERGDPVLHILCPPWSDEPDVDWYGRLFPKAKYVYPDVGALWRTERALLEAGCIVTPGAPGEVGSVRQLIETVYGDDAVTIPAGLQGQTQKAVGKAMADASLAGFNTIALKEGYCDGLTGKWYEESELSTRIGEESLSIYLARKTGGELRPLYEGEFAWERSAVRVPFRGVDGLAAEWQARFGTAIEILRKHVRLLEGEAFVLPLVPEKEEWVGMAACNGRTVCVRYGRERGLEL